MEWEGTSMMTEEKRKKVRNILLTPIECTTRKPFSIRIEHDNDNNEIFPSEKKFTSARIISSQKYSGALDPDMSDFAIKFYEIVYRDILESQEILKGEGLYRCVFAGDTINSFNSIANNVPGAGQSAKQRTEKKVWPLFLREYHNQYHCLANFWILPMCIGRTGAKLNKFDSVDIFLNKLKENDRLLERHADYYKRLKTYDEFRKKHFIENYVQLSTDDVLEKYRKKDKTEKKLEDDASELVKRAYKCMESRAESISLLKDNTEDNIENKICEELYKLFDKLKILY